MRHKLQLTNVAALGSGSAAPNAAALTAAWAAAVVTNGGTVSAGRVTLITAYIQAIITAGAWALYDDFQPLVAENEPQALTSLKQLRLATLSASPPTFTTDRGYAFNGTSQYIKTGFIPSTMAVAANASNIRMGIYERTNVASNSYALGGANTAQDTWRMTPRNAASSYLAAPGSTAATFSSGAISDSRGFSVASRAGGGTTAKGWINGVALTDVTGLTVLNVMLGRELYISAQNNVGTASQFRAATEGWAEWGAPLTDTTMELAVYNALQTFMTAVGANV